MTATNPIQLSETPPPTCKGSSVEEAFSTMLAVARTLLHTVKARKDFDSIQTSFSSLQVTVAHLTSFCDEIGDAQDAIRLDRLQGNEWMYFRGLLGVLDAEAWRLLDRCGTGTPENHELNDFELCLERLVDLGERAGRELASGTGLAEAQRH